MSSSYAGPSSAVHVFSLPLEVIEQVLVACASFGSPESIASFSQSCRLYFELVYGSSDSHLWREIYLATFEDPRPKFTVLNQPISPDADAVGYDWRNEFQRRIRAKRMFQTSTVDTRALASDLSALSSLATSSPPQFPETSAEGHESANVSWIEQIFANGYPPALLRRLTLNKTNAAEANLLATLSIAEQIIMRPDWERSAAGQAFYKLFFLSGFRGAPSDSDDEDVETEERYNLRSSSSRKKEIEEVKMSESKQRELARAVARHRVYLLPYLSKDRCWGPFMRANSPPPSIEEETAVSSTPTDIPQENGKGKGKEKAVEEPEDVEVTSSKRTRRSSTLKKKETAKDIDQDQSLAQDESDPEAVQVDMSFIRAILTNFYSGLPHHGHDTDSDEDDENDLDFVIEVGHSHHHHHHHHHHNHHEDGEELEELGEDYQEEDDMSDSGSVSFYTDDGSEPSLDLFAPAVGPLPIYPPYPHLLFPDYAFLSAARVVVTENLRERYGNGSTSDAPMWPWFTTASAVEATREILLRMGVPLPPKSSGEGQDEGGNSGGDNERANGDRRRGWESLRMGSAPGFWTSRGTREGWTGMKDEEERERPEMPEPWKKDESVEFVDGWDWAGAEGRWMRAVCWMDYRDLLFHNLQASYPLAARYPQEIQETCRVFPMTLRVIGFSRVPPPNALPSPPTSSCSPSSSMPSSSSTKGKGKGKAKANGKGKEKAKEPTPTFPTGSYDPLVYALPVIHVEGEFRGSDVDETVARRARGTVRMIGDRAIRWNLISSEVSSPDRDEWVMEGVQVGGIGSAMGVVGMWTGASHERGDPIGPSWAWKIE